MPITPLGELIEESKRLFENRHGVPLTNGDIARRSQGALTRTRVQQMATGQVKAMPSPDSIRGLSLGLGVPESVVTERALASAGYVVPTWTPGRPEPSLSLAHKELDRIAKGVIADDDLANLHKRLDLDPAESVISTVEVPDGRNGSRGFATDGTS